VSLLCLSPLWHSFSFFGLLSLSHCVFPCVSPLPIFLCLSPFVSTPLSVVFLSHFVYSVSLPSDPLPLSLTSIQISYYRSNHDNRCITFIK
jgi:hypothetical protein